MHFDLTHKHFVRTPGHPLRGKDTHQFNYDRGTYIEGYPPKKNRIGIEQDAINNG